MTSCCTVPKSSITFRGILICVIIRLAICKNNTFLSTIWKKNENKSYLVTEL